MGRYYVCYSQGEYSDYSPEYYEGETQLTDKEVKDKSVEIGDAVLAWYHGLPERECVSYFSWSEKTEKYDESGEGIYKGALESKFRERFEAWLTTLGYKKLDLSGPEVNIAYGDIPCSADNKD